MEQRGECDILAPFERKRETMVNLAKLFCFSAAVLINLYLKPLFVVGFDRHGRTKPGLLELDEDTLWVSPSHT